jgi:hypothetical protein
MAEDNILHSVTWNPRKSIFRQNCEMAFGSHAFKIPTDWRREKKWKTHKETLFCLNELGFLT